MSQRKSAFKATSFIESIFHSKKKHCVGFMFSHDLQKVILIEKQKPEWQKGCLNGLGGTIEPGETPLQAMVREFKEETGVETIPSDWELFLTAHDSITLHTLYFFRCKFHPLFDQVRSMEAEKIGIFDVHSVLNEWKTVPNLKFLIPMALNNEIFDSIMSIDLQG